MKSRSLDRRTMIAATLFGAAGLAFVPRFGRLARATPGPNARALRVLVLNFTGGIRSSAAFHASAQLPLNPFGLMPGLATPFALGQVLDDGGDDQAYTLGQAWGGARLPRLRDVARQFSVLGTYSEARGDHLRARIEEPTGSASGGEPGILTRIGAGFAEAQAMSGAPAFHISPQALFGNGIGSLTKHVPVSLASFHSVPSAATLAPEVNVGTGHGFATNDEMRDRLDQAAIASRHGFGALVTETLSFHRRAARDIGARLSEDDFALASADKDLSALGSVQLASGARPLTNGMLKELFTLGVPSPHQEFPKNVALAIRLLQIGSPAVVIETPTVDFHSGERTLAPPLYGYFGRLWATLHWLLSRIPDGSGTMLERTLVVTMSDFGRDRAGANGFNAGDGSDHGADAACFYLAHAIMGAGVTPNRLIGPVDTNSYDAKKSPVRYTPQQLLVTILDALGLDAANEDWGLPTGGSSIAELWS